MSSNVVVDKKYEMMLAVLTTHWGDDNGDVLNGDKTYVPWTHESWTCEKNYTHATQDHDYDLGLLRVSISTIVWNLV